MSSENNSAELVFLCFAIMYTALSVLSLIRTSKMYKFLTVSKYSKIFYIVACVECVLRSLTFISIVSDLSNFEYETLFILVSVPDSFFIMIYLLLLIVTMNIYHHSHIISSLSASLLKKSTQNNSKFVILAFSTIISLLLLQFISYLIYLFNSTNSITISKENAYINIIVPCLGSFYIIYLQIFFSGIPTKSIYWKSNLRRIIIVCIFWTISRIIKGVLDLEDQSSLVSIIDGVVNPSKNSVTLLKSSLCIAVIIVAEMICLFLIFDYGFLRMFIKSEDSGASPKPEKLRRSMVQENPFIDDDEISIIQQLSDIKKKPLGKTFKANFRNEIVFYRIMNFSRLSSYVSEEITKEIESYKNLSVSGIIPVKGIIFQTSTVGLIYPYFENGSLFELIHSSEKEVSMGKKYRILQGIAESLAEIHEAKRVHGHLTSHNVLIDTFGEPVIGDLGFHKMKKYAGVMYEYSYKSAWSSPEVLKEKKLIPSKILPSDDIYSFGMICWEVITEQVPFEGYKINNLIESVVNNSYRPLIPNDFNEGLSKMIKSCWNEDPQKRPEMSLIALEIGRILELNPKY